MPKTKTTAKPVEKKISIPSDELEKIIEIPLEDKDADLEIIPGEIVEEDTEEEEVGLDEEEIDPFKDKWEE